MRGQESISCPTFFIRLPLFSSRYARGRRQSSAIFPAMIDTKEVFTSQSGNHPRLLIFFESDARLVI